MIYQSIKKIEELFRFDNAKIDIIGSYSDENILYPSDIDFRATIEKANLKRFIYDLRTLVKNVHLKKRALGEVYFLDFKAGFNDRGTPLKWTPSEIIINKKELETVTGFKTVTLEEAISLQKGTIKLDLIINYKGRYKEVTCNYFLTFIKDGSEFSTNPLKTDEVEKIYKMEFLNLKTSNPMKALKRLYLIVKKKEEPQFKKLASKILKFLNSKIGFINYTNANLEIINELVSSKNKIDMKLIKNNLLIIEKTISDPTIKRKIHKLRYLKRSSIIERLPVLISNIKTLFIDAPTNNFILTISNSLTGT